MKILKAEARLMEKELKDVAKEIGADPATISQWLNGTYAPSIKFVKKLKAMGFSDAACINPSMEYNG